MRHQFAKNLQSLDAVFSFLKGFLETERVDPAASYVLTLAVEEFFTNIVKYSRGPASEVFIDAARDGTTVTVCLEEETPAPFDVTLPTSTQFDIPPMDRKPGGLGIHLAKEMLDGLTYEHSDGTSRITLIKHVEK